MSIATTARTGPAGHKASAGEAATRNVFFEPWQLEPALEYLAGPTAQVEVVAPEDDAGRLLGMVPLVPAPATLGRVQSVWCHRHCFDTTPLVSPGCAEAFLGGLFSWLSDRDVTVLRWTWLPGDTGFAGQLTDFLRATGRVFEVVGDVQRPMLKADLPSFGDYLNGVLSKRRRRDIERRRRQLETRGRLDARIVDAGDEVLRYARLFMDIEASGWKGEAGTALKCCPAERAFFETAVRRGAHAGNVILHSLELDGQPIAITVNYRSGAGVWAYKTAYDESLRAASPGVQLEIEGTRFMIEDPSITWVDAGTIDDKSLMAKLWSGRRPIMDILIAVQPGPSRELKAAMLAERAYRAARGTAKRIYRSLRS